MKNDIRVNVEGYADDHQVQKQFSLVFQFQFLSDGVNDIFQTAKQWTFEFFIMINSN